MNVVKLGGGVHFFQAHSDDNFIIEKPNMAFRLGTREEAIRLTRAILAALGEPVEQKPDRSELGNTGSWHYIAILESEGNEYAYPAPFVMRNFLSSVEDTITQAQHAESGAFSVYQKVAYVGPKPEQERVVIK